MIKKKAISISISILMLLTLLPISSKHSVIKSMNAKAASNEEIIYSFLRNEMGFNVAVSCGVLANIDKESSFNPNLYGDGGTSYGICQWHNSRMNNLINYCNNNGYDYRSITGQLYFMKYELIYVPKDNGNIYNRLQNYNNNSYNNSDGAYYAARDWCLYCEVPADKETKSVARGNLAKNTYWAKYGGDPIYEDWTAGTAGQYTTKGVNTNLNIRSSPNTSSSVVGKVPAGATVNVIKTKTDGSWAYIEYNGTNGYCSLNYLERVSGVSSDMRIEGKSEPTGRLEPGKFFAVNGMIYSNLPITRVWGGVYNRDWTPTAQWTEASPGTTTYDLSKHFDNSIIFNKLDVGYYYYRIEATDDSGNVYPLCNSEFQIGDPPPIVWYNGLSPVNLGDTLDAVILAKNPWITIRANDNGNVTLHSEEGITSEMWRFVRQSDGSYTIMNFANGKLLDAEGIGTTNGTNVFTCEANGGENQKWFLYERNGGYVIRGAYTDMVLDVSGGVWDSGTNIQMYENNDSAAQTFALYYENSTYGSPRKGEITASASENTITINIGRTIYADNYELYRSIDNINFERIGGVPTGKYIDKSLKYGQTYYYKIKYSNRFYKEIESDTVYATTESKWFNELKPVDLGEKFDSTIIVKGQNYAVISDEKENAVIYKQEGTTAEMWRFTRQSDGSYKIQNFANQKALDAYDSQTANGTNVTTHKSHSGENQKWYIYALNGGYVIRAAYTDKVLDVSDGLFQNSSNIQLYEQNNTDSQVFELYDGKSTEYGNPQVDSITAYVRGTSVILTLNTPSYVDTVKIYRSYDKKNYEIIGETTEGTFKDEDLDDNQKYYYKAEYINNFYAIESPVIYAITGNEFVDGDVNGDNDFSIADIVVFQNWLLGRSDATLVNWKAADLCEDGILNVFDLCLLRRKLIYG